VVCGVEREVKGGYEDLDWFHVFIGC